MTLSPLHTVMLIAALAAGSLLTRFLPPLLFPNGKKHPRIIDELTPMIPPAVIGLLAVYSLKDIDITSGAHGLPELAAVAAVAILQLWRKNMLLSVVAGTLCYMLLIRII